MDPYISWLSDVVKATESKLLSYNCTISIVNKLTKDITNIPLQVIDNVRTEKNLIISSNNFIRCYQSMRPGSSYDYNASIREASDRCAKFIKEWLEK